MKNKTAAIYIFSLANTLIHRASRRNGVDQDIFHNKEGKDVIRLGTCNKVGIRFIDPDGRRPFDK